MTRAIKTIPLLLLVGLVCVAANAQLPDSPTGRRDNAILAVLGEGPDAVSVEFFQENFTDEYLSIESLEERRSWLIGILEQLGELEIQAAQDRLSSQPP